MAIFLIDRPRFVLVHIPKTGGTSIRDGLFRRVRSDALFGDIPSDWRDAPSCAFVRNPFDRLISAWKMFSDGTSKMAAPAPEMGLEAFVDIVLDETIIYDQRRSSVAERIRHHAIPQTHPFNGLSQAGFVGRYETLDRDFAAFGRANAFDLPALPRLHVTERGHYRDYITPAIRRTLEDFYAEDLKAFGYEY
jgi:hypothetical protein